mmetsp:Transcript_12175/g.14507  ORF Transcript_12175/g.14507 Transcript_12175/m.14507 type:complete len:241 (-) Transcript_12175:1667-2389(-)
MLSTCFPTHRQVGVSNLCWPHVCVEVNFSCQLSVHTSNDWSLRFERLLTAHLIHELSVVSHPAIQGRILTLNQVAGLSLILFLYSKEPILSRILCRISRLNTGPLPHDAPVTTTGTGGHFPIFKFPTILAITHSVRLLLKISGTVGWVGTIASHGHDTLIIPGSLTSITCFHLMVLAGNAHIGISLSSGLTMPKVFQSTVDQGHHLEELHSFVLPDAIHSTLSDHILLDSVRPRLKNAPN